MPPRRVPSKPPPGQGTVKEPTKEDHLEKLENKVKEQDDQLDKLQKTVQSQKEEISTLKQTMETLLGNDERILKEIRSFDEKVTSLTSKVEAITGVYDDLHEKMHEMDKTRKNNLLFYGIKPDFLPEIQHQLDQKVHEIMRHRLCLTRDIPTTKITRMLTGPEVRGSRPVLVNFAYWKDREEVLSKSRLLKGTNIYITEDLSRKMREHRSELNKYMRQIRTKSPHKKCAIRYDKLYIDNTPYVYDEEKSQVVRYVPPESQRPLSRNNYSRMDESYYGGSAGLVRSISVPSVNGGGGEGGERHGSRTSLRRNEFASNESLQMSMGPDGGISQEQIDVVVDWEEQEVIHEEDEEMFDRATPILEEGMVSPRRPGYEVHGGYMTNSFTEEQQLRSFSPAQQLQEVPNGGSSSSYNPNNIRTDANVTPLKLRGPKREKSNGVKAEPEQQADQLVATAQAETNNDDSKKIEEPQNKDEEPKV